MRGLKRLLSIETLNQMEAAGLAPFVYPSILGGLDLMAFVEPADGRSGAEGRSPSLTATPASRHTITIRVGRAQGIRGPTRRRAWQPG
jgi:hypothetical protein